MIDLPPPPPGIVIERFGELWRLTRSDGLFEGVFVNRKLALREAANELDAHGPARRPDVGTAPESIPSHEERRISAPAPPQIFGTSVVRRPRDWMHHAA